MKKEKDTNLYSAEEAIKKVKDGAKESFNSTVELHINLNLDLKKQDQAVRFTTTLPHGTGKTKRVAVFASTKVPNADLELSESDLDKIEKGTLRPKVDFDVVIAESRFMPKIARVAKVLGPAGVMPNPKTGTVSDDVAKAVAQVKKGKIEIKTEKDSPILHTIIGKSGFESIQLLENLKDVMHALKQNKPAKAAPDWIKTIYITSTMGNSYMIDPAQI